MTFPASHETRLELVLKVSLVESGSETVIVPTTLPAATAIAVLSPSSSSFALYGTGYEVLSRETDPSVDAIDAVAYVVESPPVASTES